MKYGGRRSTRSCDPFRFDENLLKEFLGFTGPGRSWVASESSGQRLRLAGVDEAGRGSLAGPLVAAAVVLDYARMPFRSLDGLADSKLLSPPARERLYPAILQSAFRVSWVACSPSTIDREGLHRSNLRALALALEGLGGEYNLAVVDGFELGRSELRAMALIGGDYRSAAVAAASVVAKVVRDRLMRAVADLYPDYGFEDHVGYGTRQHLHALRVYGPCPLHRLSFQGVSAPQLELWEG